MSRADGKARRQAAREKYKPDSVRCLLIAEAPPSEDRYFYFEDVPEKDYLFLGVMEVLFPDRFRGYSRDRSPAWKSELLRSFQAKGFWLLDSIDQPLDAKASVRYLQENSDLLDRLDELSDKGNIGQHTPMILVKANVYDAFFNVLVSHGYCVIDERIYFPSTGRQPEFKSGFSKAIGAHP
jgi:hypothetical protein